MRIRIAGGLLVDGTGAPPRRGDLLLADGRIAALGEAPGDADETLDAQGLVVAPGFVDMHSHGDFSLPTDPLAEGKVLQGVTTEVVGNCGLGAYPANERVHAMYRELSPLLFGEEGGQCSAGLQAYRERVEGEGASVNAACLIPHGNVRCAVLGMEERAPTVAELETMQELVAVGMREGAFGFSTGLVYPPGAYAETDEVIALAKVAAEHGGIYATHMRDEGTGLLESVDEALRIGREAGLPLQISHHKAVGRPNWGKVERSLAKVDAARAAGLDVTSDVYPYAAGSTVLAAMVIPLWAFEGGTEALKERLRDPATRRRIEREAKERLLGFVRLPGPLNLLPKRPLLPLILGKLAETVVIGSVKRQHELEGLTLGQVAKRRGQRLFDAMFDLLIEEDVAVIAIAHAMCEADVRAVMVHPATMFGTDGMPSRGGKPHPRGHGTYPRVLQRYVREEGVLGLEDAVHRMTGMVAAKLGLTDRGVLRPAAAADLVLFDPERVEDRATYDEPRRAPLGIPHVFVNGAWTVRNGQHTGARAGRVLRRGEC
jgi:N-acyl-D-amino-acid deacylase